MDIGSVPIKVRSNAVAPHRSMLPEKLTFLYHEAMLTPLTVRKSVPMPALADCRPSLAIVWGSTEGGPMMPPRPPGHVCAPAIRRRRPSGLASR